MEKTLETEMDTVSPSKEFYRVIEGLGFRVIGII